MTPPLDQFYVPKKRNPAGVAVLIAAAVLILVACCIGSIAVFGSSDDNTLPVVTTTTDETSPAPATTAVSPQPVAKAAPKPRTLSAKDVKLGVKITDKQCFGAAGCNVRFKVTVDVPMDLLVGEDWTVTYEVSGVEDGPQISQLDLHPDGTFEQDAFQTGSTPNKNTKLKAKATDVERVL